LTASTASEWLIGAFNAIANHLESLTPAETGLNLGLSAGIAAIAFGLDWGLRRLVRERVETVAEPGVAQRVKNSRAVRFGVTVLRATLTLGALWLILSVWGMDPAAWTRGRAGGAAIRLTGKLALLIVIAVAAFEALGFALDRGMGRLAARSQDPRRSAQIQTLAPIIKGVLRVTVLILAGMSLLSELGVKIGPLLAGAGVVGVALGFGAQTLVKDFITGLFFILEDVVSVGDTVRIGDFGGQVETMTLRTIRLRDFDGTLHVFPYGEAQVVHNQTKTFSYAVVELSISYEADVDEALRAIRGIGEDLAEDPAFADKVLAPIDVLGVDGLDANGPKLKARMKTRAGQDMIVQREINRRIIAAFGERGIRIPTPQMRLVMAPGVPRPVEQRG
jgi:small conductance mechanosensitive channel